MNALSNWLCDLRQLFVYREFRIARSVWDAKLRERLAETLEDAAHAATESARAIETAAKAQGEVAKRQLNQPPAPDINTIIKPYLERLAVAGTGLWRTRRNMVPPGFGRLLEKRPLEGLRKPFQWVDSTWEKLKELGLEIQDHTCDRYISGQSLKAHFEPPPSGINLHEDTVIDTITPTIFFEGKIIQMGEVVVGSPDLAEESPASPSSTAIPPPDKSSPGGKSYFAT
ncbi:MAG: hypothetical protein ABSA83_17135 [Verrucomicrobiota bacterium]|jgi:hypothetical protein